MINEYVDFEISIGELLADGYVLNASGCGGEARGTLVLPTADLVYETLIDRMMRFDVDEDALNDLGQLLFRVLFQGAVKEAYVRGLGSLQQRQRLRLKLRFATTEIEVARLPWEFLVDPDIGPLVMLDAPIVRYIMQPSRLPILKANLPLRVLLTGAHTLPSAKIERELHQIQESLADMKGYVHITVEPHLTVQKLQRLLRNGFDIWHFVGHGSFGSNGKIAGLCFEDFTGDSEHVSAPQLRILLDRSEVRLIVLNACNSARLATDPFRSLAPALVRANIPAVIAMQFSVSEEAARIFAGEFYHAVADGLPIDSCVTEGRKAVMGVLGLRRPDWGIPVVYTRAEDGRLFDLPSGRSQSAASNEIKNLVRQIGNPDVNAAFLACRIDFQNARKQIEVLNTYKQLHDIFQDLEQSYNVICRLSKEPNVWDDLSQPASQIQARIDDILGLISTPSMAADIYWIDMLRQSRTALETAFSENSEHHLKLAVDSLWRVLARVPTRINTRLVEQASSLRLADLVRAMVTARDTLAFSPHDLTAVRQLESLVNSLAALDTRLVVLVGAHNRWQEIDDNLRLIEGNQKYGLAQLETSWPDIQQRTQVLFGSSISEWAIPLHKTAEALTLALNQPDPNRARHLFDGYRTRFNTQFRKADSELLRACNELQQIGESLDLLLGAIEHEHG